MPPTPTRASLPPQDPDIAAFVQELETVRAASPYTVRNYRHTLEECWAWYQQQHQPQNVTPHSPWTRLQRDDFRGYLRHLGRRGLSRAAIQLRFCALRTFYKFLIRRGTIQSSPIRDLTMPRREKRLPRFLSV